MAACRNDAAKAPKTGARRDAARVAHFPARPNPESGQCMPTVPALHFCARLHGSTYPQSFGGREG
jgi:hypothetical protein